MKFLSGTSLLLAAALVWAAPLWAAAQTGGKPRAGDVIHSAPQAPALTFDVEVKTGSGSASSSPGNEPVPVPLTAAPAANEIKIEVLETASASGSVAAPPRDVEEIQAIAIELPPDAAPGKRQAMFAALDAWHSESLQNYNYNIAALYDPFMPIREVRGRPDALAGLSAEDEAKLPPILKLELSQLKLVAITTVTGREDASLASFEDGAGSSYILRQSDRIGRRQGRIVRIEPTRVIVEEEPRGSSKEPEVTVMKLDALDSGGLTYSNR